MASDFSVTSKMYVFGNGFYNQNCLNNRLFIFNEYYQKYRHIIKTEVDEFFKEIKTNKDTTKALEILTKIDTCSKTNLMEALKMCTYCLILVEQSSIEYAKILTKRAQMYLQLKEYVNCILDCQEVLKILHISPDMKMKLYLMQCESNANLHKEEDLNNSIQKLKDFIKDHKNIPCVVMNRGNNLADSIKKFQDIFAKSSKSIHCNNTCNFLHTLKFEKSKSFLNASRKVTLTFNKKKGRFVKAVANINQGEIIFVERAVSHACAFTSHCDISMEVCFHCLETITRPIPCKYCNAVFCQELCRDLSWSDIHQFECKGLQYGFWYEVGVAYLAFRTTLKCINNIKSKSELVNCVYNTHRAYNKSYYNANMEVLLARISSEEICLEMLRKATQILIYLDTQTNFFSWLTTKFNADINLEDLKIFIGAKFFKHTAQVMCNASRITKEPNLNSMDDMVQTVATGFFPSYCMMNHSCKPNISVIFVNDTVVVKALHKIKSGQEVFNCYGTALNKQKRKYRQKYLQEAYGFICKCVVCKNPLGDKDLHLTYKCPNCNTTIIIKNKQTHAKCTKCKLKHDLESYFKMKMEVYFDIHKFISDPSPDLMDSIIKRLKNLVDFSDKRIEWCYTTLFALFMERNDIKKAIEYHNEFFKIFISVHGKYSIRSLFCINNAVQIIIEALKINYKLYETKQRELFYIVEAIRKMLQLMKKICKLHYTPQYYKQRFHVLEFLNVINLVKSGQIKIDF